MLDRMSRICAWLLCVVIVVSISSMAIPGGGVSLASSNSAHIWGHVSIDNRPLADATIIFMPEDRTNSAWGVGSLDKNGNFEISATQRNFPLEPGLYTIFFHLRDPSLLSRVSGSWTRPGPRHKGGRRRGWSTVVSDPRLPRPVLASRNIGVDSEARQGAQSPCHRSEELSR